MPASFVALLKCPLTGSDLILANSQQLDAIRRQASEHRLVHLDGSEPASGFELYLQSADGRLSYPVVDEICVLLPSLALMQQQDRAAFAGLATGMQTQAVMDFYDQIGWAQGSDGSFQDAQMFEDLRPVTRDYIHRCHLRINRHLPRGGDYLLDIASGPIQYPEYLTYSAGFRRRVCCDVSLRALRAAKARIGANGIYLQCDITRIPLKDETMDGLVSLHTIYHVAADRQILAFREIERVLKRGASGAVVYTWGHHCRAMAILMSSPSRAVRSLVRRLAPLNPLPRSRRERTTGVVKGTAGVSMPAGHAAQASLYFHPHDYRWFAENVAANGQWRVHSWRSVSVPFLRRFVRPWLFGRALLRVIFALEEQFPQLFGRYGQYPLLVLRRIDARTANAAAGRERKPG
jgi:uncharacterized protein YbaR (Trm112 family)